jgi:predicted metal-dependent enzyme (double-stranded beta helix superfamily)
MSDVDVAEARRVAVAAALVRIRRAAGTHVSLPAPAVEEVKAAVLELAQQRHLWALKDFPIPEGQLWGVYEVNQDADGRFAVYASAARPGHSQPPHNHTTWACISGVTGVEKNVLWQRVSGGDRPGPAQVEPTLELSLGADDVFFLGPEDIHTIEVLAPGDAMHLHVYGLGFPYLDKRIRYDTASGTCSYFPVFKDIPRV